MASLTFDRLRRIGRELIGPAFTYHVHRVVQLADQRQIERLFFLARDGHLLLEIYRLLTPLHARPAPGIGYLRVSRRSTSAALEDATVRTRLLGYLEAQHFLRGERVAVVDVGWGGTIQDNLARLTKGIAAAPALHGFYLGLLRAEAPESCKQGTLYDLRRPAVLRERAPLQLVQVFEQGGRSAEGTVVGYAQREEEVVPIHEETGPTRDAERTSWPATEALQQGILEWAHDYAGRAAAGHGMLLSEQLRDLQRQIERFIFLPTHAETAAMAALTHGDPERQGPLVPNVTPLTLLQPRAWVRGFYAAAWKPAYLRRTGGPIACQLFRAYEAGKLRWGATFRSKIRRQ